MPSFTADASLSQVSHMEDEATAPFLNVRVSARPVRYTKAQRIKAGREKADKITEALRSQLVQLQLKYDDAVHSYSALVRDLNVKLSQSVQREATLMVTSNAVLATAMEHDVSMVVARRIAATACTAIHHLASSEAYILVPKVPLESQAGHASEIPTALRPGLGVPMPFRHATDSGIGSSIGSPRPAPGLDATDHAPQHFNIYDADDSAWLGKAGVQPLSKDSKLVPFVAGMSDFPVSADSGDAAAGSLCLLSPGGKNAILPATAASKCAQPEPLPHAVVHAADNCHGDPVESVLAGPVKVDTVGSNDSPPEDVALHANDAGSFGDKLLYGSDELWSDRFIRTPGPNKADVPPGSQVLVDAVSMHGKLYKKPGTSYCEGYCDDNSGKQQCGLPATAYTKHFGAEAVASAANGVGFINCGEVDVGYDPAHGQHSDADATVPASPGGEAVASPAPGTSTSVAAVASSKSPACPADWTQEQYVSALQASHEKLQDIIGEDNDDATLAHLLATCKAHLDDAQALLKPSQ